MWIANSVGLLNYKAFLLFLLYTLLACTLAAAMLLRDVVTFFRGLDLADPPEQAGRCAPGDSSGLSIGSASMQVCTWLCACAEPVLGSQAACGSMILTSMPLAVC